MTMRLLQSLLALMSTRPCSPPRLLTVCRHTELSENTKAPSAHTHCETRRDLHTQPGERQLEELHQNTTSSMLASCVSSSASLTPIIDQNQNQNQMISGCLGVSI